ncbi:LuxR family transcriptional regulator [Nereida sp. MMG025]|uniref:helix-turn-helix transcriptional regulator n=1 Tax=Nereida sp. MMG025 TaxID=2909981 RepID=UPI001F2F7C2A|nr:LuxR family transcriptional regulator [Nereida sp. MMG025]MCF6443301.1 LuxR family transcriptional regulator [Nereida sp. MMG025]
MIDRGFLEDVTRAQAMEEVWALLTSKMAEYGFDRLLYGYTNFMTQNSFGSPEDLLILSNHPSNYSDTFINDRHYYHAPMVKWALENDGSCSWSWLEEMARTDGLTAKEQEVVQFNRSMGVTCGYSISFKAVSARSKGAIALTGAEGLSQAHLDDVWGDHGRDITVMANVAHLKIISLPYLAPARSLTKRQRETLEWVGDGKTTADIATIMGLTPATVEKHLRLARECLDVETTAQAVLKASVQNQIYVLDI